MSSEFEVGRTLRAVVDRIIPDDDYPSGWQAGVGDFIQRIFATDLQNDAPLFDVGLRLLQQETSARHNGIAFADLDPAEQDALIGDLLAGTTVAQWDVLPAQQFINWLIQLTTQGFYSDPENGGNHEAVSWQMINYRPLPDGAAWPPVDEPAPRLTPWTQIAANYDAIVIGSGAGGGIAACVLAEAGRHVLLVERGSWLATHDLRQDHLRNQRTMLGYDSPAGPPKKGYPRVFAGGAQPVVVQPNDMRWHRVAMTVGGGTRVYGAQAWRFCPEDFRMASTYGTPEGSSLADWPISYEDLEPDYERAEWELGVSGDASGNKYAGPRKRGYPMPPLPPNETTVRLSQGAAALGLSTSSVPLLINSTEYNGRGACIRCGACVGFGCPGEFKTDTRNTVIPRAIATGRCDMLVDSQVTRILIDEHGAVIGVELASEVGAEIARRLVYADQIMLGAGAIETARLLLNSTSPQEPNGLGNNNDQVGRNLQGHTYAGTVAIFDEVVQNCAGPGPSISTNDYRHHNEGIIGGAMIADDFVHTPLLAWGLLTSAGAIPLWGADSKRGMRELYQRTALVLGPVQETPNPESRVTLDREVCDKYDMPVARLSGKVLAGDRKTAEFIVQKAIAWAKASGAKTTLPTYRTFHEGPSGATHQAGTCRMGSDPASSVTDAWGSVWGHDNLHIVDGSLHVTNGGVNPVLTIMALAYRVSRHVAASSLDRQKSPARQGSPG